jgi:hypothetical protein
MDKDLYLTMDWADMDVDKDKDMGIGIFHIWKKILLEIGLLRYWVPVP